MMRHRATFTLQLLVLAVAFFMLWPSLVVATGGPASVSGGHPTPGHSVGPVKADFNGDGFSDLAAGAVGEDFREGATFSGAVNVIYGSPRGLSARGDQLWSQDSPGIADVAQSRDNFSFSLGSADFNGDGFSDLAAGAGLEDVDGAVDAGAVNVIYGSPEGLTAAGDDFLTQNTPGIPDKAEKEDCFGCTVGGGDLNGDGYDDLLVGAQAEDLSARGQDQGSFHVIYGSARGLTTRGNELWTQNRGTGDFAEKGDNFGWLFAIGDFGKTKHNDLAVSVPFEDVGSVVDGGAVHLFYGTSHGLRAAGDDVVTQDSAGVRDVAEEGDYFGYWVSASQFGADRRADLAISAAFEDVGAVVDAGAVAIINGSARGPTGRGDQLWTQDSRGISDVAEQSDAFGDFLAAGDFGKGRHTDLAVAADSEDVGSVVDAGAVHVIYGKGNGLSAEGDHFWTQDSVGVVDKSEANPDSVPDLFGLPLFAANFGRSDHADLAAGVLGESVGQVSAAGAVHVFYGTPRGLTAAGDQLWTQDSPGIKDVAEEFDVLGQFLGSPT